jgi:hypothetical protein
MSTMRRLGVDSWKLCVVAVIAALVLLACAAPSFAAPSSIKGAAYENMKKFMAEFDKDGFAKVVDLGGSKTYQATLAGLLLRIDPTQTALAKYDPATNSITFSRDPRTVKKSQAVAFGETVWHEVTHAIEDAHGDIGLFDNEAYAERNIDYMTHVARSALPILEMMERKAKAGASAKALKAYWTKYLKAMGDASELPSTTPYPPDLLLIREWFGFRADPQAVKDLYLSGKALPGKQGSNLRRALAMPDETWSGRWSTNTALGDMMLTQSGATVTGYMANSLDPPDAFVVSGSLSADGLTLSGTIDQKDPKGYDWRFTATMRDDWLRFSGPIWVIGMEDQPWTLEGTRD